MGTLILVTLVVAGLLGIALWTVQQRRRSGEEYRSAHRLLSRLQLVSRQLPAGLDEVALAQQTLEQLNQAIPAERSVLFVYQDAQLVPYAVRGADRSPFPRLEPGSVASVRKGKPLVGKGVVSGGPQQEALIPLTLGARLVGVAALQNSIQPFESSDMKQALAGAQEAALRIDSGRLFADVRTAATTEERRRLAREIHDGIAQELASVGYALDGLVADLQGTQTQVAADEIRAEVRRIITELRLSIFDLRADVQPGVGLGSALTSYVQQAGTAAGLTVHLVMDEAHDRLALAQETELLRIAQEAVTNVRRHANAENVWVTCRVDPPYAYLRIADDGTGMDS
ncbi:MAG TPA: histidine kinase, partial [Actinomycetota bacterium]|nr:histidine kinase [Actinomycetota bacterium]